MKEFGSDFHSISGFHDTGKADLTRIVNGATYLADGRQGLILAIRQEGWKRLWVPEYFCYEVLESIEKHTDVKLVYYEDVPGKDSHERLKQLPFEEGDALLRMNYFGLIEFHKEKSFSVPVIEDHSHDLLNRWALYSDADWCVASLRKTLPLAEGGIIWSPKGKKLEVEIGRSEANEELAEERWRAMDLKARYLALGHEGVMEDAKALNANALNLKEQFRKLYIETEDGLDDLEVSLIDKRGIDELTRLDINVWYNAKKRNWKVLTSLLDEGIEYLSPMDDSCTPFSLVLKCKSNEEREKVRMGLIKECVYPAILWRVPNAGVSALVHESVRASEHECSEDVRTMSDCLLSVHCDGRYNEADMKVLADKINNVFRA